MKHRTLFHLAAGLALLALGSGCGGGGGDGGSSTPDRSVTSDYLTQAIDLSRFFRWTFPRGLPDCRLFIEVDDRDGFVPAGFDRARARQSVERARDAWKGSIRASGVPMESITRFLSDPGAGPFSSATATIKIRFVDRLSGSHVGTTGAVYTSNGRIDFVEIVLALRDPAGHRLDGTQQLALATHELGHALGIGCLAGCGPNGGHSLNALDIMFPTLIPFTALSGGDERTIQHLYQLSPQVLREDA